MDKRAQITIFVIIAVLLVAVIGTMFLFRDRTFPNLFSQSMGQKVRAQVEGCLRAEGNFALFVLGSNGGHVKLQEPYFSTALFNTSYLYYYGENKVPSLADMEKELSSEVDNNLKYCINFSKFQDLTVQTGKISTQTIIDEKGVTMKLTWPLSISQNEKTIQITDFSANFPVHLDLIQKQANAIVLMEQANPEIIDTIYLVNLYSNISFAVYPNETSVYLIQEPLSKIGNSSYYFIFANKLNLSSNSTS